MADERLTYFVTKKEATLIWKMYLAILESPL